MMKMGSRKSLLVAGAVTTALAVSGAGAYAAASSGTDAGPGEQAATVAPGPERQLRASGLNASEAKPLFSLANGERVGLVSNAATKCLVRSLGSRFAGETCATTAEIAEGHAVSVGDECGSTGKNLMEITGLAPEGALSVRLIGKRRNITEHVGSEWGLQVRRHEPRGRRALSHRHRMGGQQWRQRWDGGTSGGRRPVLRADVLGPREQQPLKEPARRGGKRAGRDDAAFCS